MMRCSEISMLLATRRDLSAAEESVVRAHLDDCASCAAQWSREERTSRVLRALPLPPVKQPPEWVAEEIQAMLQRKLSPRRRWRYGLAVASVAGVALIALVIFLLPTGASTSTAPRLSPLDGTYQPGSLGAPQDDPQITPTTDGQTPWNFYVFSKAYPKQIRTTEGAYTVFQDEYTSILDPDSG
ncbi:MAG: zf-HC2 domain-containing protein, partial [Chloroflexi bacterium]|nr:zf-HC2 domain-containing protein [Chloroflexota bacterium]